MPWFVSDAGCNDMGGPITSTSLLTAVSSGINNGLGSWVQLHTGCSFPIYLIELMMGKTNWSASSTNTQAMFNIGYGASGSQVTVVQDVAFGGSLAFCAWRMPVYIPANFAIWIQIRYMGTSAKSNTFAVRLRGGGFGIEGSHHAITYGQVTASSTGTAMTAPASINTKSAWTPISAAITAPMRWLLVGITAPPTTLPTAADGLIDIGIGAAAAEGIIIPNIPYSVSSACDVNVAYSLLFPVTVPTGARLAARYQATSTSTAARPNITLTGFG